LKCCTINRVTRLGEFSPIGQLFPVGSFDNNIIKSHALIFNQK
jgi:hypothetical protein